MKQTDFFNLCSFNAIRTKISAIFFFISQKIYIKHIIILKGSFLFFNDHKRFLKIISVISFQFWANGHPYIFPKVSIVWKTEKKKIKSTKRFVETVLSFYLLQLSKLQYIFYIILLFSILYYFTFLSRRGIFEIGIYKCIYTASCPVCIHVLKIDKL